MTAHRFVYPARFRRDAEGCLLVRFPDLPEAITDGADREEALVEAADCLEEAVAGRIARGDPIPRPSARKPGDRLIPVPPVTAAKAALYLAVREAGMTRVELARRLGCDEKEARRLLDPKAPTKLPRLIAALQTLGKRLVIELQDAA